MNKLQPISFVEAILFYALWPRNQIPNEVSNSGTMLLRSTKEKHVWQLINSMSECLPWQTFYKK